MKSASGIIVGLLLLIGLMYVPMSFRMGDFFDAFFQALGMHDFDTMDRFIFLIGAVLYCIVFAYLVDLTLSKLAFAPVFNGIVAFISIGVGMYVYARHFGNFQTRDAATFLQILTLPSFLAIGLMAIVRLIMTNATSAVMSTGRTKMELPDPTKQASFAPSNDRIKAATRQRR